MNKEAPFNPNYIIDTEFLIKGKDLDTISKEISNGRGKKLLGLSQEEIESVLSEIIKNKDNADDYRSTKIEMFHSTESLLTLLTS